MFEEVDRFRKARKKYNLEMFQSGVGTFHELENLEANVFKDGAIDHKHKELIALAISVTHSCYG